MCHPFFVKRTAKAFRFTSIYQVDVKTVSHTGCRFLFAFSLTSENVGAIIKPTTEKGGQCDMTKKKMFFILLGIVSVLYTCACIFFAWQGISAANKRDKHFDVYRDKAVEYIKSDADMLSKYGSDMSVKFNSSTTYRESGESGFFNMVSEVFAPDVPDTPEEFASKIEMIKFGVKVNRDLYEITFEKNGKTVL